LGEDVNLESLAKMTTGFTGADLENLTNEAALLAVRADRKFITMKELDEAITRVIAGTEKKSRVVSDHERRLTAYHEAGHAIIGRVLPNMDPIHQISIIPRGMAGGYTMHMPTEDRSYMSKTRLLDMMVSLLGGRVAEALVLKDISTGAKNDIDRVSKIARSMVTEYGMSEKVGTISFGEDPKTSTSFTFWLQSFWNLRKSRRMNSKSCLPQETLRKKYMLKCLRRRKKYRKRRL